MSNADLEAMCPEVLGPVSRRSGVLCDRGLLVYARVSTLTEEQQDGTSVHNQIEKCSAYGARSEIPLRCTAFDQGISGTKTDRPALQFLLGLAGRGDVLIVHSLSRLSRNASHGLEMIRSLVARGVEVVALDHKIDTSTPSGKLQLHLMMGFLEFERDQTAQRVREGMAKHRRALGALWGTHERFGYRWASEGGGGGLAQFEPEHSVIRSLRGMYESGMPLGACAREARVLWPARAWDASMVRKTLVKEGVTMRPTGRPSCVGT